MLCDVGLVKGDQSCVGPPQKVDVVLGERPTIVAAWLKNITSPKEGATGNRFGK